MQKILKEVWNVDVEVQKYPDSELIRRNVDQAIAEYMPVWENNVAEYEANC